MTNPVPALRNFISTTAVLLAFGMCLLAPQGFASEEERAALMALYDATDGPNWTNSTGWGTETDYCDWFGVICLNASVYEIDLRRNNLSGELPQALAQLTQLDELILVGNALTGSLPAWLSELPALKHVYLNNNEFSGSLPVEWAGLQAIQRLYLGDNQLTGALPAWLADIATLDIFDITLN